MSLLDDNIEKYVEEHTEQESALLSKINRDTNANVMLPRMLSGHVQGRVLSMLSLMIKPKRILEIGTYTGYSALCLAEGLQHDGELITIDINEELEDKVQAFFSESPYAGNIKYLIGDAMQVLDSVEGFFDLVFIDADKKNNLNYYHKVLDKVKPGAFIIIDNVLWSGKVAGLNLKKMDKDTQLVMEFNAFVHQDNRVQNVLFPIRDGLMVLRKK